MKFSVVLLAFVAAAVAGPVSISDNNVGDILTVGVNANLKLSNQVDQTIVNVLLGYLNQQGILIRRPEGDDSEVPRWPEDRISPDMIERVREWLANREPREPQE
jgi:hypothetical protein